MIAAPAVAVVAEIIHPKDDSRRGRARRGHPWPELLPGLLPAARTATHDDRGRAVTGAAPEAGQLTTRPRSCAEVRHGPQLMLC
jgi:hypothetical protein